MAGEILQILGDFTLYRPDQRTASGVAESLAPFQGEIDVFGEALDKAMRLGKRCPPLKMTISLWSDS